MSSLSRHLRESGDHGGLPFHASCPVCRAERLSGELTSRRLLGPRASAAAVALLIGSSTLTGPLAAAQVPDEMTQPPDGTEETADGTLGEEGEETVEIPDPEPPLPPSPTVEVEAPAVEPAPAPPPSPPASPEPLPPTPQPPAELTAPPAPPALEQPQPAPVEAPASPAEPPASPPAAPAPEPGPATPPRPAPAAPEEEDEDKARDRRPKKPEGDESARGDVPTTSPGPQLQPPVEAPAVAPQVVSPPDPTATVPVPAISSGDQSAVEVRSSVRASTEAPGRVHVVRPGETLWSIAKALLGDGASPARIAAMVDRLWRLNTERIRSGQPDLILPGERLLLP
jgi:hypothetical protein